MRALALPRFEQLLDISPLLVRERQVRDEAPRFAGVVVLDGRLEVLADRPRLCELPAQPAKEAHLRRFHGVSVAREPSALQLLDPFREEGVDDSLACAVALDVGRRLQAPERALRGRLAQVEPPKDALLVRRPASRDHRAQRLLFGEVEPSPAGVELRVELRE